MIVKCILAYPREDQIRLLGPGFSRNREFGVVIGREYVVLGLSFENSSQAMGNGVWVDVLLELDIPTLISAPLCLFEIIDARASRYWELRVSDLGTITLWPPSFYRESFLEDVSDRATEAVEEFWRIYSRIEADANEIIKAE